MQKILFSLLVFAIFFVSGCSEKKKPMESKWEHLYKDQCNRHTQKEIEAAFEKALAAGNTNDARAFAGEIRRCYGMFADLLLKEENRKPLEKYAKEKEIDDFLDGKEESYVDIESIKGKKVKSAWMKSVKGGIDHSRTLISVDCENNKIATISHYTHQKDKDIWIGGEDENLKFKSIIPDTNHQDIRNFICAR